MTSGPEPIDNIEWFKDNDLIRSRPRFTQSSRGTTHNLDIQAVTCDDEGIYKCVLLNNWGIASCSAEVLVEGELLLVTLEILLTMIDSYSATPFKMNVFTSRRFSQ